MRTFSSLALMALFTVAILSGCTGSTQETYSPTYAIKPFHQEKKTQYIFAVHPLHNPKRLFEVYQPVVDLINKQAKDFTVRLEASRNYSVFEQKLYSRKFHFALPNPYQTVLSENSGYRVFGKMADDNKFKGIIIVRRDSGINRVTDLEGATISFPAPTALAATIMPKYFLQNHGLDLKSIQMKYVGSQESSIMNVVIGRTTAACTWPPPWALFVKRHPHLADQLVVKWKTRPLINNGLVVRNDVPEKYLKIVEKVLFNLQNSSVGRTILKGMDLTHFEPADSRTFEAVRTYMEAYNDARNK